jgi:hypothetical protein
MRFRNWMMGIVLLWVINGCAWERMSDAELKSSIKEYVQSFSRPEVFDQVPEKDREKFLFCVVSKEGNEKYCEFRGNKGFNGFKYHLVERPVFKVVIGQDAKGVQGDGFELMMEVQDKEKRKRTLRGTILAEAFKNKDNQARWLVIYCIENLGPESDAIGFTEWMCW